MMESKGNYQLLIEKLDAFTRKFYLNNFIRGNLYFIATVLACYLILSLAEWKFYFTPAIRTSLLFGFIGLALLTFGYWVGTPLIHYFRLGKIISHEKAAAMVGSHFSEVKDKLLNVLQLQNQHSTADAALIRASIDQKAHEMKPVPFLKAIDLSKNRKYARFALIPIAVLAVLLLGAPNILRESNNRLLHSNRQFEKPAPFQFLVQNANLEAEQFSDYQLEVKIDGEVLPEEVIVVTGKNSFKMEKTGAATYRHTFKKLQSDIDFYLTANGYDSREYKLNMVPKPMIVSFDTKLFYPAYLGRHNEQLNNVGDLTLPVGTQVSWLFKAKNTESVALQFNSDKEIADRIDDDLFGYKRTILQEGSYKIYISNPQGGAEDSIAYNINVVPDLYPSIKVQSIEDTTNRKMLYFLGDASDDYGVMGVSFFYSIEKANGSPVIAEKEGVASGRGQSGVSFNYVFDIAKLQLDPGDILTYYFGVWDNDGVHGSKFTKTPSMRYAVPTKEEFEQLNNQSNKEIKDDLEKGLKEASELKDQMKEMREKLMDKKELSWEDKQNVQQMMQQQEALKNRIEKLQNQLKQNQQQQQEYKQVNKEIAEKQKRLQELFDEMLSDEMKELIREMEKLMEELNKDKVMEEMDKMELSNEQLETEMDRMLELFKQLEFEQKLQEIIEELDKLAEEQLNLSEESDNARDDKQVEEIEKKQDKLNNQFDELMDKMDELSEMNNDLEDPNEFDEQQEQQDQIDKDMQESSDQLGKKQQQKASKSQKDAGEKMKEMADQMGAMMAQGEMEQMQLDMQAIRQLLENLITLSFDQERLMEEFKGTSVQSPKYKELIQVQFKIRTDAQMVEDSLLALSKRVMQISSYVNREIKDINFNMEKGIDFLADRNVAPGRAKQQYVMTGMNNLALILDEIMQAMQQEMSSMLPGSQMCQKPGGNSLKNMGDLQKQLNQQMKGLQDQIKKGGGQGKGGQMSKELAEMAARQAAIRRALEQYEKEGNGKDGDDLLDKIKQEMEKSEEDIVNKRITNELLKRQEDIVVRLLEAEDAEREQDMSPEREAEVADETSKKMPLAIEEYLKKRQAEVDMYKTVTPALKPFYKRIVNDYFDQVN